VRCDKTSRFAFTFFPRHRGATLPRVQNYYVYIVASRARTGLEQTRVSVSAFLLIPIQIISMYTSLRDRRHHKAGVCASRVVGVGVLDRRTLERLAHAPLGVPLVLKGGVTRRVARRVIGDSRSFELDDFRVQVPSGSQTATGGSLRQPRDGGRAWRRRVYSWRRAPGKRSLRKTADTKNRVSALAGSCLRWVLTSSSRPQIPDGRLKQQPLLTTVANQ
jgi:hypothetical protein